MKKYNNTFKGIPITTSMFMHQELCSNTNTNKSLSSTKSFMNVGQKGSTNSSSPVKGNISHLPHTKSEYTIPVISPTSTGPSNWLFGGKQSTISPTKPPLGDHHHIISHEPVVLYYCMCMVSKVPATVYVTTSTISIDYNNMIGSWVQYAGGVSAGETVTIAKSGKEIYSLKSLDEMTMTTLGNGIMNAIQLSFVFDATAAEPRSTRDLVVSPVAMDCARLKAIIVEVKRKFIF